MRIAAGLVIDQASADEEVKRGVIARGKRRQKEDRVIDLVLFLLGAMQFVALGAVAVARDGAPLEQETVEPVPANDGGQQDEPGSWVEER